MSEDVQVKIMQIGKIAFLGASHVHVNDFIAVLQDQAVKSGFVWDPDPIVASRVAGQLGWSAVVDKGTILRDPAVTSVIVASDTKSHSILVPEAADAGKSMFVEKPLAVTATEADRLAGIIEQSGILFHTGHFLRDLPAIRAITQKAEQGAFGDRFTVNISYSHPGLEKGWLKGTWLTDQDKAGGGALLDLGPHAIYLLEDLCGPVQSVASTIGTVRGICTDVKDHFARACVTFQSPLVHGEFYVGWAEDSNLPLRPDPKGARLSVEIEGTDAIARFNDKAAFFAPRNTLQRAEFFPGNQPDAGDGLRAFLKALANNDPSRLVPVRTAARGVKIAEALYRAAETDLEVFLKPQAEQNFRTYRQIRTPSIHRTL